ncbi:hypothetical protein LSCM4_07380 [Leishmania orientalis]|uniref:Uncharacterized protein n=1 Tax=Leishmania orientalis TaxID=2249476 RepID=A0A836H5W7_9TRYP|nr:hypothetical protein LSCM4_07380 [Leishmania orientalis]
MISCAAIQRLERYGSLGLKRHSTEDFVSTSLKDARRANIYALTLLSTWKEAVQAVRGGGADGAADASKEPARHTDALVYAVSFAVSLTTQHLFEVGTARVAATEFSKNDGMPLKASGTGVKAKRAVMESAGVSGGSSSGGDATAASLVFQGTYAPALELLTLLKEMAVAIGGGRALRSNASSGDFTKAVAHLLTSGTDLALLLLSGIFTDSNTSSLETEEPQPDSTSSEQQQQWEAILGQALVLVAATAQMLRRVQASFPIEDLYHTRPCAALLKSVANKHRQLQQRLRHAGGSSDDATEQTRRAAPDTHRGASDAEAVHEVTAAGAPALLSLLRRYVHLCARRSTSGSQQPSAACLFAIFSLFQRLGLLHGALGAVTALPRGPAAQLCSACEDVQYWLAQLLSSTACNRATRYVVYFREDELRLLQHNVRQASEYALLTFATTPPVDPGLVGPLLQEDTEAGGRVADGSDEVTHARAALVLAQWCVSAPFFFESFCRDESWTSFAQEQRRLVLLQQSRARRGLEKTSRRQQRKERAKQKGLHLEVDHGSRSSSVSCDSSDAASVHSSASDTASCASARQQRQRHRGSRDEPASRFSFPAPSRKNPHGGGSVAGSLTSLSSRVSLLSTLSKHSAASYLSFISVLRPSIAAGLTAGGAGAGGSADGDDEDAAAGADRQMHESEDGNTNLPLILLEQLTLGLHRFMEAYPTALLDRYGLRSLSWSSIARLFAFVETSLANNTTMPDGAAAAVRRQRRRCHHAQEPPQRLFDFAQDIRYNKGMGYECLGVLFAKVVAPLLDLTPSRAIEPTSLSLPQPHQPRSSPIEIRGPDDGDASSDVGSGLGAGSDGDRTEEGFFANAAAAAATVGRAVLTIDDDPATRASVEAALSTCLAAYEAVAPQVVDMNLPAILRLAARTAAAAAGMATSKRSSASLASLSSALADFLRHITARLGRSNDLPHLVDALLGQRDFAANASAAATSAVADGNSDTASTIRSLRAVFSLAPVRQAVMEAAGASLDPESLLLRLISVAAELEEGINRRRSSSSSGNPQDKEQDERLSTARPRWKHDDAEVQRMLLALELMEALLAGVAPTSVSASAVLEQTTQLELLLNASFMAAVEELKSVSSAPVALDGDGSEADKVGGNVLHDRRLLLIQHMYTIRQCRAVTVLCLQDLGTQHVHDYLRTLEDALWQLTSHVGSLIGSLTFAELQPLLQSHTEQCNASEVVAPSSSVSAPLQLQPQLLLPSLVLQRLSLARAVSVALGIRLGPAEELRDMAAHLWDCLGHDGLGAEATTQKQQPLQTTGVSLWLANQMTAEEWASVVALSTEKHARASMMALLLRSASFSSAETTETPAWLSRCLVCITGTVLRALVDAFLSLSVEDLCDASLTNTSSSSARRRRESAHRQWRVLTASLMTAYAVVGHNPYWPSVLAHTVRSVAYVARAWRKDATGMRGSLEKASPQAPEECAAALAFAPLTRQLISLLLCTLRSEARAAEVLRRVLLALAKESAAAPATPVLSRSGMSVAYLKAIRVPATSLRDLSAPAAQTTPNLAEELSKEEEREAVAALKDLTFEEELRDVCMQLFAPAFVKRIFTLVTLCSDNTAAATALPSPTPDAAISACMSTLALLYQICLAAAQASWRAKATNGDVKALMHTPAVVFLHTVAAAFHARGAGAVASNGAPYDAAGSAVLMAFLENFHGYREVHAERRLFVHIASAATAGEKRPRTRNTTESGTGDTANDASAPSPRAATVASSSALDAVEELWRAQLRFSARAVMRLSHAAEDERSSSADALPKACIAFRQLFTCMWASANRKQHPMSKGGRGGGGRTAGGDADPNHSRSKGDSEPTTHQSSLAGGVDACLAALFCRAHATGDGGSDAVRGAASDDLRCQLANFFGTTTTATDGAACCDERSYGEPDQMWARLLCVGDEAGASALWLLWKLRCVSVALTHGCAADKGIQDDSPSRMKKFLDAYYYLNASDEGKTEMAATTSTYARAVTALRASAEVLRIFPAEAAPPLFHRFVYALLARTIPGASPRSREAASSFVVAAPAVAELLLHLFSIRPRLPAGEMLPRAQYLLVWLSHAYSSAGPLAASEVRWIAASSLPSLCIRVCAAVAAHPAVVRAADSSALMGARHSGRQLGDGSSAAQELLDTVWLLLFSLLGDSRAPLLQEGEMVQLILLLTNTWSGHSARQQVLWSRPAMLPPLLCALFTCVMRGMDSGQYSPRLLNVLASGLAAMAAHVDAATANEGDDDVDDFDGAGDGDGHEDVDGGKAEGSASRVSAAAGGAHRGKQARRLEAGAQARAESPAVPAHVKRAALAAATSALFEVAHHHMHVFTTFSSDTDFLFTDFLKVLSQHFLPTVTRPPIAHRVGVRIGGTVRSEMTFADLVYTCVGSVESKSLLKQAAWRMEDEEGLMDGGSGGGDMANDAERGPMLTGGSRCIFRVA